MIRYLFTWELQIVRIDLLKKWIFKHISQIHFLKYFINVEGTDANEEEDVPSWVHGVQEPDEDIESKTLLFEESVRRSLR